MRLSTYTQLSSYLTNIPSLSALSTLLAQASPVSTRAYHQLANWLGASDEIPLFIQAQHEKNFQAYLAWRSQFKHSLKAILKDIRAAKGVSPQQLRKALLSPQERLVANFVSPAYYNTTLMRYASDILHEQVLPQGYAWVLQEAAFRLKVHLQQQPELALYYFYQDSINAVLQLSGQQINVKEIDAVVNYYQPLVPAVCHEAVKKTLVLFIHTYGAALLENVFFPPLPNSVFQALFAQLNHLFKPYWESSSQIEHEGWLSEAKKYVRLMAFPKLLEITHLPTLLNRLWQGAQSLTCYIQQHPAQALTIGLAMQAIAARAESDDSFFIAGKTLATGPNYFATTSLTDGQVAVLWTDSPTCGYAGSTAASLVGQIIDINSIALPQPVIFDDNQQCITIPAITNLANGASLAAWIVGVGDEPHYQIYTRALSATGQLGSRHMIAVFSNHDSPLTLTSLTDNYSLVTWADRENDNSPSFTVGQIVDAQGNNSGNRFSINTEGVAYAAARLPNGQALVTYIDYSQSSRRLYGQVVDSTGKISGNFLINERITFNLPIKLLGPIHQQLLVLWGNNLEEMYGQLLDVHRSQLEGDMATYEISQGVMKDATTLANGNILMITLYAKTNDYKHIDVLVEGFEVSGNSLGNPMEISSESGKLDPPPRVNAAIVTFSQDKTSNKALAVWEISGNIKGRVFEFAPNSSNTAWIILGSIGGGLLLLGLGALKLWHHHKHRQAHTNTNTQEMTSLADTAHVGPTEKLSHAERPAEAEHVSVVANPQLNEMVHKPSVQTTFFAKLPTKAEQKSLPVQAETELKAEDDSSVLKWKNSIA